MKNTLFKLSLLLLLLVSCGRSSQVTLAQETTSEKALIEQVAEPENISEYPGTLFVPTLEHQIPADTNAVYCATLLFAWDEVRKIIGSPLAIPDIYKDLQLLNTSTSFRNVLKDNEYTASGKVEGDSIFTRAEFEKSLPFAYQLQKAENRLAFNKQKVAAFSVDGSDNYDMTRQVKILYYKNNNNFIIKLKPADEEHEIVLFKTEKKYQTMAEMADAVDHLTQIGQKERKNESTRWKYQFLDEDEVVIPDIDFDISTSFNKLIGNIFSTNSSEYKILQAWQRTAFKLDETGAEVKSEAKITITTLGIEEGEDEEIPMPKKMIFDKPFFLMLRRTDAQHPYFCLRVANTELMVKE